MKAHITITMDNAAFDEPATELARILRVLAKRVEFGYDSVTLKDHNGNTVGCFVIKGKRP